MYFYEINVYPHHFLIQEFKLACNMPFRLKGILPIHGVLFHITPLGNDLDAEGKWRQIDIKCLQFNDANVFSFRILFKTSKNQICL